jgi:hypothetical protein
VNEKIKELAKQHNIDITVDGMGFGEGNIEALAELIVRECAKIALKSGNVTNKTEIAKGEAERIYNKINEHFGIKDD